MRTVKVIVSLAAALALFVSASPDGEHHDEHPSKSMSSGTGGGHQHGHGHGAPLQELNETEILTHHAPDPLSYWAHDRGYKIASDGVSLVPASPDDAPRTYPIFMALHVVSMVLAFFAVLPLGIVLRAAKHRYHIIAQITFLLLVTAGWLFSAIYSSLTPSLYQGETHSGMGYTVLLGVIAIAAYDFFRVLGRFARCFRRRYGSSNSAATDHAHTPATFWEKIIRGRSTSRDEPGAAEYMPFHLDNEHEEAEHEELESATEARYVTASPENVEFENVDIDDEKPLRSSSPPPPGHQPKGVTIVAPGDGPKSVRMPHTRHHSHHSAYSTSSTLRDEPTSPNFSNEHVNLNHRAGKMYDVHASNHGEHSRSHYPDSSEMEDEDEALIPDIHDSNTNSTRTRSRLEKFLEISVYLGEWALVALAYVELVTGVVVYSGICRGTYANGCLAHLIKGSIFFVYGVVTFCRYLGAFAIYGWAWNRPPTLPPSSSQSSFSHRPRPNPMPTAEMVECSVIFLYGITNTWLERNGAAPGAPYTTKEIQHISIAVMYWFGGLIGMGLESKRIRRLISVSAFGEGTRAVLPAPPSSDAHGRRGRRHRQRAGGDNKAIEGLGEPATYSGSFNPFPAFVIGITGSAMAAHHQTYLFAVQLHSLWGNLLTSFAVLRVLTYVFLWLKPPTNERSVLPSRPPTEGLASVLLACGGLVFMASTEQIEFAAMRHGHDDIMMILNLVISIVCIVFCWCILSLVVKGWARSQQVQSTRHDQQEIGLDNCELRMSPSPILSSGAVMSA